MFEWSKLSGVKWIDAWEDRFHGNPNFVTEILKGGKTSRIRVFCATQKEADSIMEQFGGSVRKIARTEWANPQTNITPPLKIRDAILVTNDADEKRLAKMRKENPTKHVISIPAEMAFGTGDHATTASCLRMLVDISRERKLGWSTADLGTGTGLLVIAAKKLGAGEAYACDYDPFSVKITKLNVERNEAGEVNTEERDILTWKPRKKYDVVMANLFSTVLIQAFPVFTKLLKPKGDIIISGILATQAWEVFTTGAEYGFGFTSITRKGKWVSARGSWMNDCIDKEKS
jgi:ribosomal protein L11 methyltransferase